MIEHDISIEVVHEVHADFARAWCVCGWESDVMDDGDARDEGAVHMREHGPEVTVEVDLTGSLLGHNAPAWKRVEVIVERYADNDTIARDAAKHFGVPEPQAVIV